MTHDADLDWESALSVRGALLSNARRLAVREAVVDDLLQEGLLGAAQAAARFTESGGASLRAWMIRRGVGAMQDYLRQETGLRINRSVSHRVRLVKSPLSTELPIGVGIDGAPLSIADVLVDDSLSQVTDQADDKIEDASRLLWAWTLLRYAKADEREVLIEYYANSRSMREIGLRFGLTESRISQIHKEALSSLRERIAAGVDAPATDMARMPLHGSRNTSRAADRSSRRIG